MLSIVGFTNGQISKESPDLMPPFLGKDEIPYNYLQLELKKDSISLRSSSLARRYYESVRGESLRSSPAFDRFTSTLSGRSKD
jgi:hypothetical protein